MREVFTIIFLLGIICCQAQKFIPEPGQELWQMEFPQNELGKIQFSEIVSTGLDSQQLQENMIHCALALATQRVAEFTFEYTEERRIQVSGSTSIPLSELMIQAETGDTSLTVDLLYHFKIEFWKENYSYTLSDLVLFTDIKDEEIKSEASFPKDWLPPSHLPIRNLMTPEQLKLYPSKVSDPFKKRREAVMKAINHSIDLITEEMERRHRETE